jgi:predicted lipid-binding transport protein (Tim44 family)
VKTGVLKIHPFDTVTMQPCIAGCGPKPPVDPNRRISALPRRRLAFRATSARATPAQSLPAAAKSPTLRSSNELHDDDDDGDNYEDVDEASQEMETQPPD